MQSVRRLSTYASRKLPDYVAFSHQRLGLCMQWTREVADAGAINRGLALVPHKLVHPNTRLDCVTRASLQNAQAPRISDEAQSRHQAAAAFNEPNLKPTAVDSYLNSTQLPAHCSTDVLAVIAISANNFSAKEPPVPSANKRNPTWAKVEPNEDFASRDGSQTPLQPPRNANKQGNRTVVAAAVENIYGNMP